MSRHEVIDNIGTIARSGARDFPRVLPEEPGDFVSRLNDLLMPLTDQVDVPSPTEPQGA